jgi:hypothetical protein
MPSRGSSSRRISSDKRRRAADETRRAASEQFPSDLASLLSGLYARVARKIHFDASYVSRVARRERHSTTVEAALRRELNDILLHIHNPRLGIGLKPPKKKTRPNSKRNAPSKSK